MKLKFYKYNNYFNRIVKSEPTLQDYEQYKVGEKIIKNSFDYGDGVNTSQVITLSRNEIGDYLILTDDEDNINSRWFILESKYIRGGQYQLTLKRDLMVDYKDSVLDATTLIKKATLDDNDPMIYNKEPVNFNQIKKSETPLMDETHSAWVVGYIPRGAKELTEPNKPWSDSNVKTDVFPEGQGRDKVIGSAIITGSEDIKVDSLANWEYNQYITNDFISNPLKKAIITTGKLKFTGDSNYYYPHIGFYTDGSNYVSNNSKSTINTVTIDGASYEYITENSYQGEDEAEFNYYVNGYNNGFTNDRPNISGGIGKAPIFAMSDELKQKVAEEFPDSTFNGHTQSEMLEFLSLANKVIFETSTNKYYRINITPLTKKLNNYAVSNTLRDYLMWKLERRYYISKTTQSNTQIIYNKGLFKMSGTEEYKLFTRVDAYKIILTEIQNETYIGSPNFGKNRYHLDDQPYDMFAIPIGNPFNPTEEIKILQNGVDTGLRPNLNIGLNFGTIIAESIGSANIFDTQLLPYCPISYAKGAPATIDIKDAPVDYIYKYNKTGNDYSPDLTKKLGVVLWAKHSSFSFDIPYSIPVTEKKIQNQCDMHRLCSPNYNGLFDFNVARNNGVDYFNIDCSYKPFSPYIHINPNFKGLYGSDFNGTRGLICGGDFSLPQISDAWANYQLQNKNYDTMFNRETTHLDTEHHYDMVNKGVQTLVGTLTGAASGAAMGGVGGPVGATIGGIAGGIASLAGGVADMSISQSIYKENMGFRDDMRNLQLDNIKALPQSLTKVSAFNYNNKIFPFIEYYTCTDEEKEMFRNMLKYDGMTVDRIGKVREFLKPDKTFIQGRIIKIDDINEDSHLLSEINNELNGGIYI